MRNFALVIKILPHHTPYHNTFCTNIGFFQGFRPVKLVYIITDISEKRKILPKLMSSFFTNSFLKFHKLCEEKMVNSYSQSVYEICTSLWLVAASFDLSQKFLKDFSTNPQFCKTFPHLLITQQNPL